MSAVVPPSGSEVSLVAGVVNVIDTTNGGQDALFPVAASVPNGTPLYVKLINYGGSISLLPSGGDTIDGHPSLINFIDANDGGVLAVSNGADTWVLLLDSRAE